MKISKMPDFSFLWILPIQFPVSWKSSLNVWRQAGYSWKVLQRMEDRPAIGGSFCLECPYTCTAVCIRYLKTYNPQYGKGQQYMNRIKQTMGTEKGKVRACILVRQIWSSWVKIFCKMQFIRVVLVSIGPSSQKFQIKILADFLIVITM